MKLITFLLGRSSRKTVIAVLMGLVAGICNAGVLAIISQGLSDAETEGMILGFAVLCVVMLISRIISEVLLVRVSLRAIADLRIELSRRIVAAPLRRLEELGPHRLLATLTEDAPMIVNALTSFPLVSMHIAVVAACLVYLGILSWTMLVGVLGFILFGIATYQLPISRAMRHLDRARHEWDALFKHFRSLTEGLKELKLNQRRQESFVANLLQRTSDAFIDHNVTGSKIYVMASGWGHLLIFVLIGLLVFWGKDVTGVDKPTLATYAIAILYMMTPLEVIISSLPIFGRANIALKKIEDLGLSLASRTSERSPEIPSDPATCVESIELAGVTHTYYREGDDQHFVLGPIDLKLFTNEVVFLVGPNGCGKTTLAKLLVGLYFPEEGEIRLNGKPVTDESRREYRENFSVVFSDFFVFEQLLGLESPRLDEQARDYLARLQLNHKVQVVEGGLSTTELSQGQRKRLALLTAYLEDRPIYLFDEWAADQDPLFKEIFYHQLLPELKARGKTVIVITHDDRYYSVADRLVKLEYGRIELDSYAATASMPAAL